ncbi:glycosyltransferase family 2 protein [Eubacteriaceae bacterium ES3]|nr:glycosyltransferase family 2 protein [Eubacteriaceae bacterium ES3]
MSKVSLTRSGVLIIVPAYNEEESIGPFLETRSLSQIAMQADWLIVNDASTDQTAVIAGKYDVKVISQVYNMGYGAALQLGYKYAVEQGYEYVLQLDADGQHDIRNLDLVYKRLTDEENPYDIVIGSRFLEKSVSYPIDPLRKMSILFFRTVIKWVGKADISDPTSGLQGLGKTAFEYYAKFGQFDYKYPDVNMIMQMLLQGFKIAECEAIMHPRKAGVSMHVGIWKPCKYIVLMFLSTINAIARNN